MTQHQWFVGEDKTVCVVCSLVFDGAMAIDDMPECPGPEYVLSRRRDEPRHVDRERWYAYIQDVSELLGKSGFSLAEVGSPHANFLSDCHRIAKERL